MAMAKMKICSCAVCLLASVALNISLFISLYFGGNLNWNQHLSWSLEAAVEAEATASVFCSGHGSAFLDGLLVDGRPVCECNTCFQGPDCSQFIPNCAADADSGDPLIIEPFWREHAASSAVVVAGWHRMSYTFNDHSYLSQELEKHIREVHAIARNANTSGKYILFGAGSTQLLNAAVFALSTTNSSYPSRVVASAPYYPIYRTQTDFFDARDYKFEGEAALWKNISDSSTNTIEFVTSPNNPDGQLKKAVLQGPRVKTIYDRAYYWPHFTAIPEPADDDLMIFTISKLTGHAGSRFGWAILRDEAVYQRMQMYISLSEMGISRETQLRALKLLKTIVEGTERDIFDFAHNKMRERWERLSQVLSKSKRFSIQQIAPMYCNFFQTVRGPSPAYAWLKCEREEDKNCYLVLRAANIIGREGTVFEADSHYVRLSLLKSQDDFDLLLHRLNTLVSEEDGAKSM